MHMAPYSGGGFPIVLECESAAVTREFALQSDVVIISCRDALRLELECGALRELVVRPLAELGSRTPLRTEIGVVRLSGRTRSPASELLLELLRTRAEEVRAGQGLPPAQVRLSTATE
jgi:hypothetical protein